MVPVCWALDSADVNAGTARAARIAIIAITTSNSISVNAEMNFLIFIVGFCSAVVLRVLFLRGFGFGVVLRIFSERFVLGVVSEVCLRVRGFFS